MKKTKIENMNDTSLKLWYGICQIQSDWKEEDRDEDYDEIIAEYNKRFNKN